MTSNGSNLSPIVTQRRSGRKRKLVDHQPWEQRRALDPVEGPMGPYVESFVQHYMTIHSSWSSAYYYRRDLANLAQFFPGRTPMDLSRKDLLDFVSGTTQGLAPRSKKRLICIIRSFYRWLDLMELIEKNPAVVLQTPKCSKPEPRFMTHEQVKRLFHAAEGDILTQTYLALGAYAGLRRASIHDLLWDDVDFDADHIIVRNAKGGKNNIIPIARPLRRYLTLLKRHQDNKGSDSPYVINHYWRTEWRPYSLTHMARRLKETAEQAGLSGSISTHDLRRTFATNLHQSGVDTPVISRLLGHSDISTTLNHYAFTNDEQKERAIEKLPY